MALVRLFSLFPLAVAGLLFAQQPDPYPGSGPPTSGSPGSRPGQVPSTGGGPSIPSLGGKKKRSQAGKPNLTIPTASHPGMLVTLGTKKVVILADDKRVIRYELSPGAKFYRMKGQERTDAAASELLPGDRVTVDSAEDEEGTTYAIQVIQQRAGTEEDKKKVASIDQGLVQARVEPIPGGEPETDDRPRIRRKDGTSTSSKPVAEEPKAPAPNSVESASSEAPQPPATVVVSPDRDKGDDEFGRVPKLHRGKPVQTASSRAPATIGPTPPPAATPAPPASSPTSDQWKVDPSMTAPQEEHPMLTKAREAVRALEESMPNYICQQITTRYTSTKRHNPDFHAEDIISAEVVVENGRERYRNLQVNFKPTKKSLDELGGARSTGEFYTVLADLFDPSTAAEFRYSRPETIANRVAYVFNYKVAQPHSHWTVHSQAQSYRPAFKGSIWVDKETARVLRLEMQATAIPADFTYDIVELANDYDFVRIGSREYMVPVKSENLACEAANGYCARNVIEFKNYRKFTAESEITPTK